MNRYSINLKDLIISIVRKCFIFNTLTRPIIPFKVNLLYYKRTNGQQNVGDLLSLVIFKYLMRESKTRMWSLRTKRIAVVGSIIQFISAKTTIFGSGFLDMNSVQKFAKKTPQLCIKAVRGPLTAKYLARMGYIVPPVYGDPAILMPLIYPKKQKGNKIYDYIIIPHYSKLSKYQEKYDNVISTLTDDWRTFIDTICAANFIISASLHGIILAETYGIPAILLNDTESMDLFKYKDYY